MEVPGSRADPFNLNYDRQFLEIEDEYDQLRNVQKACYGGTKKSCFNSLSLVFGIILAFVWGMTMGLAQFVLIWFVIPFLKLSKLYYTPAAAVIGALLNACFGKCLKNVSAEGTTVNVAGQGAHRDEQPVADGPSTGYPKI